MIQGREVAFGTSGVRGLVAHMTREVCFAYAQAFIRALSPAGGAVVVGHDLRPSSPRIAAHCIQAVRASGLEVVFAGAAPTPAVAAYAMRHRMPAIVVTGSHIPFDRNGLKFYRPEGEISKADESLILAQDVHIPPQLADHGLPERALCVLNEYKDRYTRFFDGSLSGRRVALYEHSSAARDILREILEALGAEVISLGRTDEFVPIDTEAVRQEDIAQARAWAKQFTFDAIVSTDGDADRPLIGDEQGRWLRGDMVGTLCAQFLKADVVVTPVSSNTAVERCSSFSKIVRTRIGSPYVIAAMENECAARKTGPAPAVVGYEANGGFLLGSGLVRGGTELLPLPTRDAVLPIVALLVRASQEGCAVSALANSLPARFTASDRLQGVAAVASAHLIDRLMTDRHLMQHVMSPEGGSPVAVDLTDGLRVTFQSEDVVHLRPSGNAPELRCYAEAQTEAQAALLCQSCLSRASDHLPVAS